MLIINNKQSAKKCTRRNCYYFVVVLVICFVVVFVMYNLKNLPYFNQNMYVRGFKEDSQKVQELSRILLWNPAFGKERWDLPADTLGPEFFRDDLQCPVYGCEITNNRNLLPSVDMFDAVLFHVAEPFPLMRKLPSCRNDNQLYVFAIMEPPGETKHTLSDEIGFYNLTMTYRLDSDIVWPYKYVFDIETNQIVAPAKHPKWRDPPNEWNDTYLMELWPNKTKTAAWFVSHCNTLSKREQLVHELKQYIDIDIYGNCGEFKCPYQADVCDDTLDRQYKFYFAFENALCKDYVTEKLFNAMNRNLIPIVFGGAEYSRFVPPRSYINVENFSTVQELASYIIYLSENTSAYMRYFWWRKYYTIHNYSPYCDLCEKLSSKTYEHKIQVYENIEKWWLSGSCRFSANIKF